MPQETVEVRPVLGFFVPWILGSTIAGLVLGGITGLICFAIPRLRRYAFQAASAPFAFAVCSIVGMTIITSIANQVDLLLGEPSRLEFFATYMIPGLISAGLAVWATGRKGLGFVIAICTALVMWVCGLLALCRC
jgi:hypothetical protein